MSTIISWVQSFTMSIGGPGLFIISFLDSSFLSLPEINDLLVITMVIQNKDRMVYYALMATFGSVAGCFVLYFLGRKGGETLIRRRFGGARLLRAMDLSSRYGILAVAIPAVLPPPAPFKIFVLLAGVARVPLWQFSTAVTVGRGFRYFTEGLLAIRYGDQAIAFVRENGQVASLVVALAVLVVGAAYIVWRARREHRPLSGTGKGAHGI